MVSGERYKVADGVVEFLGDGCGVEDEGDTVVDRVEKVCGVENDLVVDGVEVVCDVEDRVIN